MGLMDNKICMVTGATSGIGYYTAQELARMGAAVILVGRDEQKCIQSAWRITDETGNQSVEYLLADLSSQAEIRSLARLFYERHQCLDVLVNNAGGFFLRRKLSVDGIEMTLAVNHLAYFLLTNLLMDALAVSPSARVVSVSSGNHEAEHLDLDNLQLKGLYNPISVYGRSKLANLYFTYELARKLAGTHITANALTPGMVATDIWKVVNHHVTDVLEPLARLIAKTPLEGAQTSIYLASSPEVEGVSGKYFANKKAINSSPLSYDENIASRLWDISSELVGLDKP